MEDEPLTYVIHNITLKYCICHTCDLGKLGQLKAFVYVFALAHELAINKFNDNAYTFNSVVWATVAYIFLASYRAIHTLIKWVVHSTGHLPYFVFRDK